MDDSPEIISPLDQQETKKADQNLNPNPLLQNITFKAKYVSPKPAHTLQQYHPPGCHCNWRCSDRTRNRMKLLSHRL